MRKGWLSDAQWRLVQSTVPVPCVDLLPIKKVGSRISGVGLIYRDTPQGPGWCVLGGRLLRNESFKTAIARQVRETLGAEVRCISPSVPEPVLVTEYFSLKRRNALFDPRQHAIGVVFPVQLRGAITPGGEALDFRWFDLKKLPKLNAFGFGQEKVVAECIRRLQKK
jgi:ADP-ribose pyrophosphatase YjhB (NUDIX family)